MYINWLRIVTGRLTCFITESLTTPTLRTPINLITGKSDLAVSNRHFPDVYAITSCNWVKANEFVMEFEKC